MYDWVGPCLNFFHTNLEEREMPHTLLRPKEAAKKTGISLSHLYQLVNSGQFPQPIKISERITAYVESEVDEWIQKKIHESRGDG